MTYYQPHWNIYVANLIMQKIVKDSHGIVREESCYISVELFQFENPAEAYTEITRLIQSKVYDDAYRENEEIAEQKCLGIGELDLLQTNINELKTELTNKESYGITISHIPLGVSYSVKSKQELKLFDRYYNYKKDV